RRHTRSKRDWSSDVCSSDLERSPVIDGIQVVVRVHADHAVRSHVQKRAEGKLALDKRGLKNRAGREVGRTGAQILVVGGTGLNQIGRASCRERVEMSVVGGD